MKTTKLSLLVRLPRLRLRHDLKRIKLNRVKRKPYKALSGGGYIRGRGDFAIQAPPPYKKKN